MCDKQTIIHRKPSPQSFTSATLMIHKRMSLLIEVCTTPYKKNDAKGKKVAKTSQSGKFECEFISCKSDFRDVNLHLQCFFPLKMTGLCFFVFFSEGVA